ncbi:protein phosphatase 2C domain-containing protein [Leptolyngbya iicbica]|uniref:Protein phosphatase 2C domain-containing protein n=2 Tax=Cyanophyceae TaxID=3028117 RepID=A0A4Q7E5G5_9CYAN|nr:protein phosphatase 2C domain-containing protein [Leptolyngbya sp. LK]RZM77324.1 protein phosphatase 2C domain-containing protein [Leptolyngbya sp. LK]
MKLEIEVAAGSVVGRDHRRVGKNNQDAWAWTLLPQGLVAVVCDGCGSQPHSEVGARLGAALTVRTVQRQLTQRSLTDVEFWPTVQQQVLRRLRSLARQLGHDLAATVQQHLLFTLLGAIVTPQDTVVFGLGDGVYALNGEIQVLGPYAHNAPPYLAYHLLPADALSVVPPPLQIHCQQPTETVATLLLGSDGVVDLMAAASLPLPGKTEPVGELSQFWQNPYFQNPDRVRRRLTQINHEQVQPDWERRHVVKQPGLLPDDTTLVCLRRRPTC